MKRPAPTASWRRGFSRRHGCPHARRGPERPRGRQQLREALWRIDQILQSDGPTVSFEFFPPKTDSRRATLYQTVAELRASGPSYVVGHLRRRRVHAAEDR